MAEVGVIGAGSWGIALAKLLHTNGNKVTVWSIVEDEIKMLQEKHEHVDKLPGVKLPEDIIFTTDLKETIQEKMCWYLPYLPCLPEVQQRVWHHM